MNLRVLPESRTYGPPGRCIYCGTLEAPAKPAALPFTNERIVPYALRGNLIFKRAVCQVCKRKTHPIEEFCLQETLQVPRMVAGWRSRKRKRPTTVRTGRPTPGMAADGMRWTDMPAEQAPLAFGVVIFHRPGLLFGKEPTTWFRVRERRIYSTRPYPEEWRRAGTTIIGKINLGLMCRLAAKIAHAAALAELGLDAFTPYLPPIILGDLRLQPNN